MMFYPPANLHHEYTRFVLPTNKHYFCAAMFLLYIDVIKLKL